VPSTAFTTTLSERSEFDFPSFTKTVSAARASSVHTFCMGDLGRQAIKKIDKLKAAYFICLIFTVI
jgi:hypothetical protein